MANIAKLVLPIAAAYGTYLAYDYATKKELELKKEQIRTQVARKLEEHALEEHEKEAQSVEAYATKARRIKLARDAYDVLKGMQKDPEARVIGASQFALQFAKIMKMIYPLAFDMNPGLARSIETRLASAMKRNLPDQIEALERVMELEIAAADQRAFLGQKSTTPIAY